MKPGPTAPPPAGRDTALPVRVNRIGLILVPLLVLATGCTVRAAAPDRPTTPPFADCLALTAVPPSAPPGADPAIGGDPLPAVELPCLGGGPGVRPSDLRGPAVMNLWASWCVPCRQELPALQRFATRAGDAVHVVGVVTRDDRDSAVALATDLGVSFPALEDPEEKVVRGVPGPDLLPVTVLIDRAGRTRLVHQKAVDEATLSALVERHLGVRVPA